MNYSLHSLEVTSDNSAMQKIAGTAGGRSLLKRQGSTVRSLGDATASSMNASLLRAQQGGRYPVGIKFEIYHIRTSATGQLGWW